MKKETKDTPRECAPVEDALQTVLNEIAKNAYIAEQFGNARSRLIRENAAALDALADDLHAGIAAHFEYDGHDIRCKLVMSPSPRWSVKDCVIYANARG